MDRIYRYQRYLYDFTRKYYLFGRDRLLRQLPLQAGQSLIEIGCGTGRNLIVLARSHPEAHLFGLDASAEMLKTARRRIVRLGLEGRITSAQGLAEDLKPHRFGQAGFDHALFSYSLSMIPDWRLALAAAQAALAPGGWIHIVDFGDFAGLPAPTGRALEAWLRHFHVTPRRALLEEALARSGRLALLPGRYAFISSEQQR